MSIRKSRTAVVFAAVIAALAITSAWAALGKGTKAPDFKLQTIDGKTLTLSQIRQDPYKKGASRVVLLDFWATYCPPCRAEIPFLQKMHEKYGKKGLAVVGVSLDGGGADDVKPFAKANKMTYNLLIDKTAAAARAYGVRPIPTTFIIDKKGIIRDVHIGYYPALEKVMEDQIKELLK